MELLRQHEIADLIGGFLEKTPALQQDALVRDVRAIMAELAGWRQLGRQVILDVASPSLRADKWRSMSGYEETARRLLP